jgi:hypothetical protein
MKKLGIVLAVLLLVAGLLVAGLQWFLTQGLTAALNEGVFPAVRSLYGLEMSIDHASVNLFKGRADLSGFKVRNLAGYHEPFLLSFESCRLELDLRSLLRRNPVIIRRAEAQGAELVIERNASKKINVQELAEALKPVQSQPRPEATTESAPASQSKLAPAIPVHIQLLDTSVRIRYVDSGGSQTYQADLQLIGHHIFTVPAADQPASMFVLRGALTGDQRMLATDLSSVVQPLLDPQNPSFTLDGSVAEIRPESFGELSALLRKNDLESRALAIKPVIVCKAGRLDGSLVNLELSALKIHGAEIGDTTLKLPLNGTLNRPVLDLTGALRSLFSEQSLKIGKAIGMHELKKEVSKELGVDITAPPGQMVLQGLSNNVKEVADSPALQELIQQVVPGAQSTNAPATTNSTGEAVGNALAEQLGKNVKELEGNEAVKETLKGLGTKLFGK